MSPEGRQEIAKRPAEYVARSRAGIVAALRDARAARLEVPLRDEHARRLLFGFVVPITLLRIAWSDPQARRSLSRRLLPPVLCLAIAAVIAVASTASTGTKGEREHPGETFSASFDADDDDPKSIDEAKGVLPAAAVDMLAKASAAAKAAAPPPSPPRPTGLLATLRAALEVLTSRAVKILAGLGVVEWLLVWIGREHHDLLAYETSVLTGVPGEPLAAPPRLRFDLGWLKLKAWRAIRFVIFLALVGPFAWLLGEIPVVGPGLSVVVEGAWAAYWASVFAIANSFVVWESHRPSARPWFIRVLDRFGRVPVLGLPVRLYARVLTVATRNVWPACTAFEYVPWESAGLAVARGVASVPFVYLIFRPMFAPAATHALVGKRSPSASADALPPPTP